jgi:DNA replication licensing factor MCM5
MYTDLNDRDRLRSNLLAKQYVLEVDLDHLIAYNEELANRIRETPAEIMPLVRTLLTIYVKALGAEKDASFTFP